ncbi:MAG: hypothetical protein JW818_07165 [Pirellulales bacterium]|nr:hypothetical protein [Pirellulales bacterium]
MKNIDNNHSYKAMHANRIMRQSWRILFDGMLDFFLSATALFLISISLCIFIIYFGVQQGVIDQPSHLDITRSTTDDAFYMLLVGAILFAIRFTCRSHHDKLKGELIRLKDDCTESLLRLACSAEQRHLSLRSIGTGNGVWRCRDLPFFQKLQSLDLSHCSDAMIFYYLSHILENGNQLQHLDLSDAEISDMELISCLRHLRHLTSLNLSQTPITDAGLASLHELSQLKDLNLKETGVTGPCINKLREMLPHCTIKN